jgi:regulator of protease activity HflC (stomatin/prohibitin superfamily)
MKPTSLRNALFPNGATDVEQLSARYREDLSAETQLRLEAVKRAEIAERVRDEAQQKATAAMAEKQSLQTLLEAERVSRETVERRLEDVTADLFSIRDKIKEDDGKNEIMELKTVLERIESVLGMVPEKLASLDKRLTAKPIKELVTVQAPPNMTSFVFKPIYDADGRAVSLTATPIKGV